MPAQSRAYLFGGDLPWEATSFTASDDRVRGGSSTSHLTILRAPTPTPTRHLALFNGTLDTKTLGGAGFASQRSTASAFPDAGPLVAPRRDAWDLSGYGALEVVVVGARSDGKRYVVTVKDEVPERRGDGREGSGITWEWEFAVEGKGIGEGDVDAADQVLEVDWAMFKPTFRGRDVDRGEVAPLNLGSVKRVGIMMRSFFGEQEGEFALCLASIAVVKMEKDGMKVEEDDKDEVHEIGIIGCN